MPWFVRSQSAPNMVALLVLVLSACLLPPGQAQGAALRRTCAPGMTTRHVWNHTFDAEHISPVVSGDGQTAIGIIWPGTDMDDDTSDESLLASLNLTSGDRNWNVTYGWQRFLVPALSRDARTVFVDCANESNSSFVAFDSATGKRKWVFPVGSPLTPPDMTEWKTTNPIISSDGETVLIVRAGPRYVYPGAY